MRDRKEPVFKSDEWVLPLEGGAHAREHSKADTSGANLTLWILSITILLGLGAGFLVWNRLNSGMVEPGPKSIAPGSRPASAAASVPNIKYPIEAGGGAALGGVPEDGKIGTQVTDALLRLLGREAVGSMLQTGDFVRRVVVTVDNLGREHAASRLWPVNPAPGRFSVSGPDRAQVIDAENASRYVKYVRLLESVDAADVVALYIRLYPLFQRAYEDLGYPGLYFNDRLVEVIDLMLAAPEPLGSVGVQVVEVKGPVKPLRPWLNYDFTDAELRKLSAGQKLMVRVGLDNERHIKKALAAIRLLVTAKRAITR